jgi:hypothetical protein
MKGKSQKKAEPKVFGNFPPYSCSSQQFCIVWQLYAQLELVIELELNIWQV